MFLRPFLRLVLPITVLWSLSALNAEARINSSTFVSSQLRHLQEGDPPPSEGGPPPEGGSPPSEGGSPPSGEGTPPAGGAGGGPPPPGGGPPGGKGGKPEWRKGDYDWDVTGEIPPYAASFSIFGSLWIIIEILRDQKKRRLCYHRLIFAMSFFDLASSISYLVSSFFERPPKGTRTTQCEVPGFFLYWASLAIPMYNAALATYFYLSVVSGWREEKTWKKFERYAQVLIPLVTLIVAIVPWPMEMYNPFHGYCFIFGGKESFEVIMFFVYTYRIIVLVATLFVTVIMMAVYCQVKKTFERSSRFSFARQSQSTFSTETLSSDALNNKKGGRKSQRKDAKKDKKNAMVNRVRNMAYLYTIPFYATWTIPVIWMFIEQNARELGTPQVSDLTIYVMHVWLALFLPLQGFLNWLIYMFPRFQRIRAEDRSKSICLVLAGVLGGIFKSRRKMFKPSAGKMSEMTHETEHTKDDDDDDNESMIGDMMYSEDSGASHLESLDEESVDHNDMESGDSSSNQEVSPKSGDSSNQELQASQRSQSSQDLWLERAEEDAAKSTDDDDVEDEVKK